MFHLLTSRNPIQIVVVSGEPAAPLRVWGVQGQNLVYASPDKAPPDRGSPYDLARLDSNNNPARRTRFESELAMLLRRHPKLYMQVVFKVSHGIEKWIVARLAEAHKVDNERFIKQCMPDEKEEEDYDFDELSDAIIARNIGAYLYTKHENPYFGVLGEEAAKPKNDAELIQKGCEALHGDSRVEVHLNFHRMFVSHLVDDATIAEVRVAAGTPTDPCQTRYLNLRTTLQPNKKYAVENPSSRQNRARPGGPRTTPGIIAPDEPQLPVTVARHTAAVSKYERATDPQHPAIQSAAKHNMPFVAGPSASAAELFICAGIMQLTDEEMRLYALAVIAFMVTGGMHSFHEIMKSAKIRKRAINQPLSQLGPAEKRAGIPYVSGNYMSALPMALLSLPEFKALATKYPELTAV